MSFNPPSIGRASSLSPLRKSRNERELEDSIEKEPQRHPSIGTVSTLEATSKLEVEKKATMENAVPIQEVERLKILPHGASMTLDFTRVKDLSSLPAHIRFALRANWASTALGPVSSWSADLRLMFNLLMSSPHPTAMYWGKDLIVIYNEPYIHLAGSKHPKLMGSTYPEAWSEIWPHIEPDLTNAIEKGIVKKKEEDELFLNRGAGKCLEETYFSWSIIPLIGFEGLTVGLYNPASEDTRRVVTERRMQTLRKIGDKTALAKESKTFWRRALEGLDSNAKDAPFVLVYSVDVESDRDSQSSVQSFGKASKKCYFQGSSGFPEGNSHAIPCIDLENGMEYLAQLFREAINSEEPVYLSVSNGTLDPKFLEGIKPRGHKDACRAAVCCSIRPPGAEQTLGFLLLGVNPRRPYDEDYRLYCSLLNRQLATSIASVVLIEDEIAKRQKEARLAAEEKDALFSKLEVTTQEAKTTELRFNKLAELNPNGMFIADANGEITFFNKAVFDITEVSEDDLRNNQWMDKINDEDREYFSDLWAKLVNHGSDIRTEIRFKAPWKDWQGEAADRWVLLAATVERNEDNSIRELLGSITDISQQKWAEHMAKRNEKDAMELRRTQETFLDFTSHELRNPLTSILQSADEVREFLLRIQSREIPVPEPVYEEISGLIDAVDTSMISCDLMKRIINDILDTSKMAAGKLAVTPMPVQPRDIGSHCVKMFEGEAKNRGIKMQFAVDDSFKSLGIAWVSLDPSRVKQCVINLITNAIKFTAEERERKGSIIVALGASLTRLDTTGYIKFVPLIEKAVDPTEDTEKYGAGRQVYLQYSITDSGRGLTDSEKSKLFARFEQAKPDDHIHKGGSGLGLYIARTLSELLGGQIGVASEPGVGSTFSFFIKARQCDAPSTEAQTDPLSGASSQKTRTFPRQTGSKTPTAPSILAAKNIKFLVVEDNALSQRTITRQLQKAGHTVYAAWNGKECLDWLHQSTFVAGNSKGLQFDILLMDQEMPVMDGIQCTEVIREMEARGEFIAHIPILGVSGNVRPEQVELLMRVGMDGVLPKPFKTGEVTAQAAELLGRFPMPS